MQPEVNGFKHPKILEKLDCLKTFAFIPDI